MSYPTFDDYPMFTPTLTPEEMFQLGVFGGAYFRPIHSGVTNQDYHDQHLEFDFLENVDRNLVARDTFDYSLNAYGVKAGSSLKDWESRGWIVEQDPYGWVQWYCRFYQGRRSDDDDRQVDRWNKFAGPKSGRFRTQLINKVAKAGSDVDESVSPVVRQGLLQWAYVLTQEDYDEKLGL
jgi:hypothetical protein